MGETHVNEKKSMEELMNEGNIKPQKNGSDIDRLSGLRKKTDLSDIILEKENSTNERNKKFILGAASLVLLFLIFLIISKMINADSTPKEADKDVKTDTAVAVKQEKSVQKEIRKKVTNAISKKEEPAVSDTDLKFEEMVRKLREEDAQEENIDVVKVVTPPSVKKVPVTIKPEETKKEVKVVKPKPKPKVEQKVIITEVKKDKVKKPVSRPKTNLLFAKNSGYYIQVGATTSPTPGSTLANKITSNGYHYITHPIMVKGRKFYKVLIGPFNSKDAAKAKLPRVKATINPQAFLYHLR